MGEALLDIAACAAGVARRACEPFWPSWKAGTGYPDPDGVLPPHDACILSAFAMAAVWAG